MTVKLFDIKEVRARRRHGAGSSVKSTDTPRLRSPGPRSNRYSRRGICAAILGVAALLHGPAPGRAQATDEERRRMEIEGKQLQQQHQKQQQDRANEKANSAHQQQQFQQREQNREDWIRQLEQRNRPPSDDRSAPP